MNPRKFARKIPVVVMATSLLVVLIISAFTPAVLSAAPADVPASVTVTPVEATNPVRTQHTLTASVKQADGSPAAGVDVEWILNRFPTAVGDIVDVSNGSKADNLYATGITDANGEATMTITATREGDTDITVYVPGIADASKHKVFAVKHWVDMMVDWPPDGVNKIGTDHTFTVKVYKATDGTPLNGIDVRWTITDDTPDARFKGRGNTIASTTSKTNAAGIATITIQQASVTAGDNFVSIEVMQGGRVMFQHDAKKTWLAPSLNVMKDGPATAEIGTNADFTITVSNDGKETATGVTVTDTVPAGLTFVSSVPAGTVSGSTVTWNVGTLLKDANSKITATFTAAQKGTWINRVNATSLEGITATAQATIEVTGNAVLGITKTGPATATQGDKPAYTITVTNNGKVAAENTVLTDTIPAGMSYAASTPRATVAGNTATWNIGTLNPGATSTVSITLNADQTGTFTNRVAATATDTAGVQATAVTEVKAKKLPDVSITKTGPPTIYLGQNGQFTITVTNTGETPLTNAVITDTIPANLSYFSSVPVGTAAGKTVTWTIPSLALGASQTINLVCRADALGVYSNAVAVVTDEGVTDTDTAAGEVIGKTGVTMQMTDTVDPIPVGARTTYQITITNQGVVTVHNARLSVQLPGTVSFVSATGVTGFTTSGQTVTFDAIGTLVAGRVVNYTVTVTGDAAGDVINRATLTYDEFSLPITTEEGTTIYTP